MSKNIKYIEGIGPKYAMVLSEIGIRTTDQMLKVCGDRKGRNEISQKTDISETKILKWVNMCDLFRIKGVAGQYAELLENSGVDTVKELRNRNAENLTKTMRDVNKQKRLCKVSPSLKSVQSWVEQAKSLDPAITH